MWSRQKKQMKGTDSVVHSIHTAVWYTQYTHNYSGEMFVKVKYL